MRDFGKHFKELLRSYSSVVTRGEKRNNNINGSGSGNDDDDDDHDHDHDDIIFDDSDSDLGTKKKDRYRYEKYEHVKPLLRDNIDSAFTFMEIRNSQFYKPLTKKRRKRCQLRRRRKLQEQQQQQQHGYGGGRGRQQQREFDRDYDYGGGYDDCYSHEPYCDDDDSNNNDNDEQEEEEGGHSSSSESSSLSSSSPQPSSDEEAVGNYGVTTFDMNKPPYSLLYQIGDDGVGRPMTQSQPSKRSAGPPRPAGPLQPPKAVRQMCRYIRSNRTLQKIDIQVCADNNRGTDGGYMEDEIDMSNMYPEPMTCDDVLCVYYSIGYIPSLLELSMKNITTLDPNDLMVLAGTIRKAQSLQRLTICFQQQQNSSSSSSSFMPIALTELANAFQNHTSLQDFTFNIICPRSHDNIAVGSTLHVSPYYKLKPIELDDIITALAVGGRLQNLKIECFGPAEASIHATAFYNLLMSSTPITINASTKLQKQQHIDLGSRVYIVVNNKKENVDDLLSKRKVLKAAPPALHTTRSASSIPRRNKSLSIAYSNKETAWKVLGRVLGSSVSCIETLEVREISTRTLPVSHECTRRKPKTSGLDVAFMPVVRALDSRNNRSLKVLRVPVFSTTTLVALLRTHRVMNGLEKLYLVDPNHHRLISGQVGEALAGMILSSSASSSSNSVLNTLSLGENSLSRHAFSSLSNALSSNPSSFEILDMEYSILHVGAPPEVSRQVPDVRETAISFFDSLSTNTYLKKLDLSGNIILPECMANLVQAFESGFGLEELTYTVSRNNSNVMYAVPVGALVAVNSVRLRTLELGLKVIGEIIDDEDRWEIDWNELSQGLQGNKTLENLCIRGSSMQEQDCTVLVNALSQNATFKCLKLDDCCIDSAGALVFAQFLRNNSALEELDLSGNPLLSLGDDGQLLEEDESLGDQSDRSSGDENVSTAFASALEENSTLKALGMYSSGREMSKRGAAAMAKMLKVNTTLLYLSVSSEYKLKIDGYDFRKLISYYQRLNYMGRKEVSDQPEKVRKEVWMNSLLKTRNDMDCSFYLMRLNPGVFFGSRRGRKRGREKSNASSGARTGS